MFTLRFDMRAPTFGAPIQELYSAALEMCAWAEDRGALVAVLSEHHGTEDRHLPSPLVLASPIAAGGPQLFIGGGSVAAARRAGRFGLGLIAQAAEPGLRDAYEAACRAAGHEPGVVQLPDAQAPTAVFVADDVDRAWEELGRYLLHDAVTAASYRHGDGRVASISTARSVDELRADTTYRVLAVDEAVAYIRRGAYLPLLPLCGGLPPEVAWPYLERAADATVRARA